MQLKKEQCVNYVNVMIFNYIETTYVMQYKNILIQEEKKLFQLYNHYNMNLIINMMKY